MSACRYPIGVGDPAGRRYERVEALVDKGNELIMVPASLLRRLDVPFWEALCLNLPDGRTATRSVGVVSLRAAGRVAITLAVFGDEDAPVQVGVHTLLGLRLTVGESRRTLVPARARSPGCVAVKGYEGATVAAGVQRGTPRLTRWNTPVQWSMARRSG